MSLLTLSEAKQENRVDRSLSARCGLVLAAGDGKRMQAFIRRMRGDTLPKQFVSFTGDRSLFEQACLRAEQLIPSERLFSVVGSHHLAHREVCGQLSGRTRGTIIFQPKNKDTGPGLLLPLIHLYKEYPESIVAVYPSDHYLREGARFMEHIDLAYNFIEEEPSKLILLGMQPHCPDPEYGYIMPGNPVKNGASPLIQEVMHFTEKPDGQVARELVGHGGLWNTMIMVFKTRTLLELFQKINPWLCKQFEEYRKAIGTPSEMDVLHDLYDVIDPVNFSKDFLETLSYQMPSRITVLPVEGVYWNDWGSEKRIKADLAKHLGDPQYDLTEQKMNGRGLYRALQRRCLPRRPLEDEEALSRLP